MGCLYTDYDVILRKLYELSVQCHLVIAANNTKYIIIILKGTITKILTIMIMMLIVMMMVMVMVMSVSGDGDDDDDDYIVGESDGEKTQDPDPWCVPRGAVTTRTIVR